MDDDLHLGEAVLTAVLKNVPEHGAYFNLSTLNGLFSANARGRCLGRAHRTEGNPVPTEVGWLVTLPYWCSNSALQTQIIRGSRAHPVPVGSQ